MSQFLRSRVEADPWDFRRSRKGDVFIRMTTGAVRINDDAMVRIWCYEN